MWWLTLALDAAAQGHTAQVGVVVLCTQIRVAHLLQIHHEAEAAQPCQLRQLSTCDHHLPRPSSLVQALHVHIGVRLGLEYSSSSPSS